MPRPVGTLIIATAIDASGDKAVTRRSTATFIAKQRSALAHILAAYGPYDLSDDYALVDGGVEVTVFDISVEQNAQFELDSFAIFARHFNAFYDALVQYEQRPTDENARTLNDVSDQLGNERDMAPMQELATKLKASRPISITVDGSQTITFIDTPAPASATPHDTDVTLARINSWEAIRTEKETYLVPADLKMAETLNVGDTVRFHGLSDAPMHARASSADTIPQREFEFKGD